MKRLISGVDSKEASEAGRRLGTRYWNSKLITSKEASRSGKVLRIYGCEQERKPKPVIGLGWVANRKPKPVIRLGGVAK